MKWIKKGNIFSPNNNYPWMYSHAANPFAINLDGDIFRVYFTSRDKENRSFICCLDFDINNPNEILNICNEPVLSPGELGMFDDSGVAMGYYTIINNLPHIYYLGWNLKVTVPWLNSIGLAKFNPLSNKFEKASRAPILDRSNEDPFSISYPSILFNDNIYKMWYGSNLGWGKLQNDMRHVIKYAESNDGIFWKRSDKIAINLTHEGEYAISKPFVLLENNLYKMWYSYRGNKKILNYRIGYAESLDGVCWERKDDGVGIDVSSVGWDSEMICYPFIFNHNNKKFMLYNGNGYGKTGFGIAVLEN